MTPWSWWAGVPGEDIYDVACEEPTREACILTACQLLDPGDTFRIVEARSSTAMKYDEAESVPFVRQRNHETLTVGPRDMLS